MATNFFFQSGIPMGRRSESLLMEDLVIECIKIYGFDVYYMPRQEVHRDWILGEDPLNKFINAYPIECYLENVTGFGGNDMLSKFGVELRDTGTFLIARRRWDELVRRKGTSVLTDRPAEGDLLFFPLTKSLFQIKLVEGSDPFFQVGKLYVYKLQCEIYQYSHEDVSTGVSEIDSLTDAINENMLDFQFSLESSDGFISTENGEDVLILEEYDLDHIDKGSFNDKFDEEAPFVLDFSEKNPFGEVI